MSIRRSDILAVQADAARLLERIREMEAVAGWTRYERGGNKATGTPHPDDTFNYGQYTAAVKRASMDLSRSLVRLRR